MKSYIRKCKVWKFVKTSGEITHAYLGSDTVYIPEQLTNAASLTRKCYGESL
jgi:hypothetical protein